MPVPKQTIMTFSDSRATPNWTSAHVALVASFSISTGTSNSQRTFSRRGKFLKVERFGDVLTTPDLSINPATPIPTQPISSLSLC